MDLKALGFEIAEGVNDPYLPGDSGIFVSKVEKGSIAEGRLRYISVKYHQPFIRTTILFLHAGYYILFDLF